MKKTIKSVLSKKGFEDHKAPVSRRDFVKLGLLAGGGALMPASLMNRAYAATAAKPTVPFLVFDLAGGASLPGNFLVGKKGGPEDFCDYTKHGWNPRANSLDKTFGIPMAAGVSQMLAGLKSTLPAALQSPAQNQFKMGSFCHFSLSDNADNPTSALTLMSAAGSTGKYQRNGLGQRSSASGGNSAPYLTDSRYRPQALFRFEDILSLIKIGPGFDGLAKSDRRKVLEALVRSAAGDQNLEAQYRQLFEMGSDPGAVDVRLNRQISALYNVDPNAQDSAELLESGIIYNVLQGNTGPGAITIDGCDYHDNTGTTGDAKDLEIGRAIGRAVHSAYLLGKPLFFQVISDGGIQTPVSQNFERVWEADENLHTLSVIGYFDPRKQVEQVRQQVGSYGAGGQVDLDTFMGKGTDKMVLGVLANYLNVQGQLGRINEITGQRPTKEELEKLLIFA